MTNRTNLKDLRINSENNQPNDCKIDEVKKVQFTSMKISYLNLAEVFYLQMAVAPLSNLVTYSLSLKVYTRVIFAQTRIDIIAYLSSF